MGCTGIEPVVPEAADLQSTESPLILPTHGATGRIRTYGFRDLQSLALGLSATVACHTKAHYPKNTAQAYWIVPDSYSLAAVLDSNVL